MSWLEDFMDQYAKRGMLGVGWFARDKEVCLNSRGMPIVAVCDTAERAEDIAEALNFVTRIGMGQRRNSNTGNTLQESNVVKSPPNRVQKTPSGHRYLRGESHHCHEEDCPASRPILAHESCFACRFSNVGNFSQEALDDIDGSRRDWSRELSNVGQQADGFRETELSNIGFEDGETDSCVHDIPYRYFCPVCDGGYECDGFNCPQRAHDHYV